MGHSQGWTTGTTVYVLIDILTVLSDKSAHFGGPPEKKSIKADAFFATRERANLSSHA